MHFVMRRCVICFLIGCFAAETSAAESVKAPGYAVFSAPENYFIPKDTTVKKLNAQETRDSIRKSNIPVDTNQLKPSVFRNNSIDVGKATIYPYNSLQQMLKGEVAGVYIQEPNGEPGTEMGMMIRGTAIPITSHKDIYDAQPLVVVDGVPLIMDHPFAFDIQQYDYNRIGPATNLLATIDPNNIASIEVLKDYADAAIYGPRAANGGVISIHTKAPVIGGRKIAVNSWFGFSQRPQVSTTNAQYENQFRQPYYDRYASLDNILTYPLYLRDSTNNAYYGPANWTDLYFSNKFVRGISASLSSGTERANFRFAAGNEQTQNPGDNTKLDRYNAMFELNMVPVSWLTMSTMINATRLERQRNRSLRDRFADAQYLPDLGAPLPPNKEAYGAYLDEYDKSFDTNKSNSLNGYFRLKIDFSNDFHFVSSLSADYNEGLRDLFYPSTLMETVNYVSDYFGSNQRFSFNNTLTFHHEWDKKHDLVLEAGEVFESDFNRYNYSYAYNGPNDLIKLNLVNSDPSKTDATQPNLYLTPKVYNRSLIFMFLDQQRHRLLSFYGRGVYHYKDALDFSVLLRADGSSSAQPDNWWSVSPTFSAGWDLKSTLLQDNDGIDALRLHGSWGRIARLLTDDRFGEGPLYTSDLSFSNNPLKFSYNALPALSRPYSTGYVGTGIKWPYSDQLDLGLDMGFLHHRLNVTVDVYNKTDNNMLFNVPGGAEYGYTSIYQNGLKVRNRGADLTIQANVLPKTSKLQWIPSVNFNYNQNTLLALPGGLDEAIIGSGADARMLKVGSSIDQFWVLENQGIYNREKDIPTNLNYKGTPISAGDPIWKDVNGDNTINDKDKVLKGHYLPQVSGGFSSDLVYGNITFSFSFYYALGKQILNKNMANHLDFVNHEGQISMDAVKEITFWEKPGDYNRYPLYDPWSKVGGYRADQDLFLENGSFLKLRNVSLQYDFTKTRWWNKKSSVHGLTVYGTANNLFTITPYTGGDPELIYYNGVDDGYGLPISRSYTLGIKMDL